MKIKALILAIFVPAILFADPYTINPALGFIASVNDARARAMGRTELMSSTGPNAMFANPANLINVSYLSAQISGQEMSGTINDGDWTPVSSGFLKGSYPSNLNLSQIAFAMPFSAPNISNKAVAAIGYDTYLDWRLNFNSRFQDSTSGFGIFNENTTRGGLNTISIAGALEFKDLYSLGFALHKSINSKLKVDMAERYEVDADTNEYLLKVLTDYNASALFAEIGVTAKLPADIDASLIIRPRFTIKLKGQISWGFYPDHDIYEIESKIKMGDMYGLGLSKKFQNWITIAVEYQNRPYSVLYFYTDKQQIGQTNNGHCFRIGLETQTLIPVRLGYFIESVPIDGQNDKKATPKSLSGITAGIGLITRYFCLDTYAEFSSWSYNHISYLYEPPVEYKRKESLTSFGATMTVQIP